MTPRESSTTEVVHTVKPSLPTDPRDTLTVIDVLALMLLKDFIAAGFPAVDPTKQVEIAYLYAELMSKRRKDNT